MKKIVFFLILSVVYVFTSCGENKTGDTGQVVLDISIQDEQGSSITQALTRAPAPAGITMVTISVTGLVEPVAVDIDSLESSFEVPAGKDREFVTRAFNSTNKLIYHGAVKADIIAGEETRVAVILVSVSEPIETSMNPAAVTIQPVFTGATPANITSYSIRVTSPLSTLITSQAYTPGSAIQIPSGNTRLIEITAYSPTGDYSGTVTQDFAAGEVATVQVNISMQYTAVTINLTGDPANATSYSVTVTTAGETALAQNFTPGTAFDVPSGSSKQFDIIAYSPTGDYSGTVTQDLTAGESVSITVAMQYADVTINPVLPSGTPTAGLSYIVTVTTSGSAAFTRTFAPGIEFRVPPGDAMDFEILVSTPSVTFRATSAQNLAANSSVIITPNMVLYETKIIIPDYQNNRLVQIDDMSASTVWITLAVNSIYDVDFDKSGRIYMAINQGATSGAIISWIDDLTDSSPTPIYTTDGGFVAITVDRITDQVYFASSSQLYRTDLDGGNLKSDFVMGAINTIRGMAIDDDTGIIYIAGSTSLGEARIFKYNPTGGTGDGNVDFSYSSTDLGTPWDVLYKSPYIYVANLNGPANNQIIRLNVNATDLTFSFGYGSPVISSSINVGDFYGPRRFVAILNRRITLIDDYISGSLDKLVSIDTDFTDASWQTYRNSISESAAGEFNFYTYC